MLVVDALANGTGLIRDRDGNVALEEGGGTESPPLMQVKRSLFTEL